MQLTITTDYAIRIVLYLASHKGVCASSEIAVGTGVSQQYITRIMGKLRRRGIVAGHAGQYGGYTLAREPDKITLLDIMLVTEKTMQINHCTAGHSRCSQQILESCPVRKVFLHAQEDFERRMGGTTVAQLIAMESTRGCAVG